MSAADRIASGAAPAARATSSRKDCGARMSSVDRSDCRPLVRPASKPDRNRGASCADLTTTLLAPPFTPRANFPELTSYSNANRRQLAKPARPQSKTMEQAAWRPYLYAAAHAPSLLDLERIVGQ